MKKLTSQYQISLATLALVLGLTVDCLAQSVWVDEADRRSTFGVELMIPSFNNSDFIEFPTSAFTLYGRAFVGGSVSIKADLPVSHFSTEGGISETDIGNPYLGLTVHDLSQGLNLDLGIRLPLAPGFNMEEPESNAGLVTGSAMENYNLGIYMPETFSVGSNLRYRQRSETGLIVKAGGGPDVLVPTSDDEFDRNTELFLNYYGQVLYGADNFSIGAGLTGLLVVTEKDLSFGDRTIHELGIIGSYKFDNVKLDTYLRTTLDEDEFNDILNFVLGLNLSLQI